MGTLGWLSWRVYHRGQATFTTGANPILPPDAYFYSIRAGGSQIGVSSITIDTLTDGIEITERMGLDLPIQLSSSRSQYTTEYVLGTDLRLREFTLTLPGIGIPVVQHGVVEGDTIIVVTSGTGEPSRRIPVEPSTLVPQVAATVQLAVEHRLRTGTQARVVAYNPATSKTELLHLSVVDDSTFMVPDSAELDPSTAGWVPVHSDTMQAWKIEWKRGDHVSMAWVDRYGLPLRTVDPSGLEFDRSAFEIVTINYRKRVPRGERAGAIIPRSAIASGVDPTPRVRTMRTWLSAQGITWRLPESADSQVQRMDGDVVTTQVLGWDSAGAGFILPAGDSIGNEWKTPDPLLGLADSLLVRQARAVLAKTTDPVEATRLLAAWVSRNIRRTREPVTWSAPTVLRRRQGDVDGHTLLFVGMARASGI
ncbi:MAG: transglutaminase-like domain-containing protein, partial [Gemmatimonadota bacterium]